MTTIACAVGEDPKKPGYDLLGSGLDARGHFIHEVMAADDLLTAAEIGARAKVLAAERGADFTGRTFDPDVTGNHLRQYLRDKMGYAEQLPDKRWRLTKLARERIGSAQGGDTQKATSAAPAPAAPEVRTVDSKSRLLLPKEFANATVAVERVSENEIRIRKAVVVPADELPLIEDQLKPLSDRDRDLFLNLLDNPPEPTPALLKALKAHGKRHG
jgi:hypothetical protein